MAMMPRRAQAITSARQNLNTQVSTMPEIFRAARVAPMTPGWPLLEDAAVVVQDQMILDVGPYGHLRRTHAGPVRDLGSLTLAPAVFNSHTHLEMTHMLGKTTTGQGFVAWVESLLANNAYGVDEPLVRTELTRLESRGCAFVADISTRNAPLLAGILASSGLGFVSFQEAIGSSPPDDPQTLLHQVDAVDQTGQSGHAGQAGQGACAVAGHALYSTGAQLMRAAKDVARAKGLPFSLHLAEHAEEDAILLTGQSPFLDLLRSRGILDGYSAPGMRPVPLAQSLGLLDEATLCVHCVTVTDEDIALIAASRASVCLCPRSNEHIGVGQAPLRELLDAGVKVKAYDPVSIHETQRILGDAIYYAPDQYDALIDADCLMLVTEWPEFKFPNFNIVKKLLKDLVVFDGRNIYEIAGMKRKGFAYYCIGVDTTRQPV